MFFFFLMRRRPPESTLTDTRLPDTTLFLSCAIGFATVTELTPDGPCDRGSFTDGMSSGAGLGQSEQDYEGRIVAAVPDKSFTVAYTGTRSFKQQYVLKDGKYALIGKDQVQIGRAHV